MEYCPPREALSRTFAARILGESDPDGNKGLGFRVLMMRMIGIVSRVDINPDCN